MDIQVKKIWLITQILDIYDEKVIDRIRKALQKNVKSIPDEKTGMVSGIAPEAYPKLDYTKYKFKSADLKFNRDEVHER